MKTASYVAQHLAEASKGVAVEAVTGELPPEAREERIAELAMSERRVLVCTDCLSEGINLQEPFDTVIHYDLSWNPTKHEQREGRVDRYGQPKAEVRALTYWGKDNPVDGVVLDVLLRKHQRIPTNSDLRSCAPEDRQGARSHHGGARPDQESGTPSSSRCSRR